MSLPHFFLLLFAVVVFAVGAYLIIKTERASIPPVWHPKIALWDVIPIRCRFCSKEIKQDDLVAWYELADGSRSTPAHAACAVLITKPDGMIKRADGSVPPEDHHPKDGYVLMPEEAWAELDKQARTKVQLRMSKETK